MASRRSDLRGDFRIPNSDAPDRLTLRGGSIILLAAAIVAIAQLLPGGPARAVVVAPIVLLVPGWAAYVALFGPSRPADPVVGATFVAGLGMGVLIVNGLAVNALGIRLSELPLVVGPALIAAALFAVGEARGADPTIQVPIADLPRFVVPAVVLCCAVAIAAGAVTFAAGHLPDPHASSFSELSFAPAYARVGDPTHVEPGNVVSLPLQLRLSDKSRIAYRVHTFVDGREVNAVGIVARAPLWNGAVRVVAPAGRCLHTVRIDFTPVRKTAAATTQSLDTFLSVSVGPACQH